MADILTELGTNLQLDDVFTADGRVKGGNPDLFEAVFDAVRGADEYQQLSDEQAIRAAVAADLQDRDSALHDALEVRLRAILITNNVAAGGPNMTTRQADGLAAPVLSGVEAHSATIASGDAQPTQGQTQSTTTAATPAADVDAYKAALVAASREMPRHPVDAVYAAYRSVHPDATLEQAKDALADGQDFRRAYDAVSPKFQVETGFFSWNHDGMSLMDGLRAYNPLVAVQDALGSDPYSKVYRDERIAVSDLTEQMTAASGLGRSSVERIEYAASELPLQELKRRLVENGFGGQGGWLTSMGADSDLPQGPAAVLSVLQVMDPSMTTDRFMDLSPVEQRNILEKLGDELQNPESNLYQAVMAVEAPYITLDSLKAPVILYDQVSSLRLQIGAAIAEDGVSYIDSRDIQPELKQAFYVAAMQEGDNPLVSRYLSTLDDTTTVTIDGDEKEIYADKFGGINAYSIAKIADSSGIGLADVEFDEHGNIVSLDLMDVSSIQALADKIESDTALHEAIRVAMASANPELLTSNDEILNNTVDYKVQEIVAELRSAASASTPEADIVRIVANGMEADDERAYYHQRMGFLKYSAGTALGSPLFAALDDMVTTTANALGIQGYDRQHSAKYSGDMGNLIDDYKVDPNRSVWRSEQEVTGLRGAVSGDSLSTTGRNSSGTGTNTGGNQAPNLANGTHGGGSLNPDGSSHTPEGVEDMSPEDLAELEALRNNGLPSVDYGDDNDRSDSSASRQSGSVLSHARSNNANTRCP